jgi:hypothetical protein
MSLRSVFPLVVALTAVACMGSPAPASPDISPDYVSRVPPARPTTVVLKGSRRWFAINSVRLGYTVRETGVVSPQAWRDYGFDLDGRNTTAADSATSRNSCKRISGSPMKVLADGNGGIDNNFGQHSMAVIKSLRTDAEDVVNAGLADGVLSWVLRIDGVPDDFGDNASAPGALFGVRDLGAKATFTEADDWPVVSKWLEDGRTIDLPKVTFPGGYIAGGVWVSGPPSARSFDFDLQIAATTPLSIPVDAAILSVRITDGAEGTLAGAMAVTKLPAALDPVVRAFGICPDAPPDSLFGPDTYKELIATMTQAADLVLETAQFQDTSKECDAISLGIGFTMKPTRAPTRVVDSPPAGPDPCAAGHAGPDGGD